MRIEVETKHLIGHPKQSRRCPLALALRDVFPGQEVTVWPDIVAIGWPQSSEGSHILGRSAKAFVAAVDRFDYNIRYGDVRPEQTIVVHIYRNDSRIVRWLDRMGLLI